MIDAFEKADRWRSRAAELRIIADTAHQQAVRWALLDMANSFEHHAHALTKMAIALHCTGPVFREDATTVVADAAD